MVGLSSTSIDTLIFNFAITATSSFVLSIFILAIARAIPRLLGTHDQFRAVQSAHARPTARIGGVAIFVSLVLSFFLAPIDVSNRYALFLLCTSLLFMVGLLEDLGHGVSPRNRLLAAFVSSALVIVTLSAWIPRFDIPVIDRQTWFWVVSVPMTLIATAGLANGFNLIDGVNGLAGFTGLISATALAAVAWQAGYENMVFLAVMLAGALTGFLIVNYPFGLIFLGDAGAYTLGFVLSWFAISTLNNIPEASAWAFLLILYWPIADTMLAIWRRSQKRCGIMAPDRLHVHQLVMRALLIHVPQSQTGNIANPLTTAILLPFVLVPTTIGVALWDKPFWAFIAFLLTNIIFFGTYILAIRIARQRRK